jgi:hypothetical protein
MKEEIVVVLRRHDQIEEILPYIETIVQPGMRVVFFVPYPMNLWPWLCDHWVTTESRIAAVVAGRRIMNEYSSEMQKNLAEQRISLARAILQRMQVEVVVDIYTASVRRAVHDYCTGREACLVFLQTGKRHTLIDRIRKIFFGSFRPHVSSLRLVRYLGQ